MRPFTLFVAVIMVSHCCSATSRRPADFFGIQAQGEKKEDYAEKKTEAVEENNKARMNSKYPESGIGNHHSIPREYFDENGGAAQGDDSNNTVDGRG